METYFTKFGQIVYGGYTCVNITERTALIHNKIIDPDQYTPVTIDDKMRPDTLAYQAYNDAFMDWEIWLNNNVMDPYFDWHLNDEEFQWYIIDKYGDLVLPQL